MAADRTVKGFESRMQYAFLRNSAALVTAIEKGVPLSTEDFTLAVEHLFLHPERLGPSGLVAERILASAALSVEHISPLIFALGGSDIEHQRLQLLFEKMLQVPLLKEVHLIALSTALASSHLSAPQKIHVLEKLIQHPSKTTLVLMGRFFSYELNFPRKWIGLGVIEVIAFLDSQHELALPLIKRIAETPASNVQCQRSLVHALEVMPFSREQKHLLLTRVLHWPNLCQYVHRRLLHSLKKI